MTPPVEPDLRLVDGQRSAPPTAERRDLRRWWPVTLQVAGVGLVGVGFGMIAPFAGLIASGIGCLAFGIAEELSRSASSRAG